MAPCLSWYRLMLQASSTQSLWLVALTSCGFLAGCQNPTEGTTLVEGQVVEHVGRQPFGGATVQVWQAGKAGGYGPVGSGQPTDSQGRFSFRFEADSKSGYLVMATALPGYITDWGLAPSLTAGRKNKDLVIPMYAPAWVRLVLVDELPKSRVEMTITGYSGGGERLRYPVRDTILIRPILANLTKSVTWWIYAPGQERKETYSFEAAALDTVTVRIPF